MSLRELNGNLAKLRSEARALLTRPDASTPETIEKANRAMSEIEALEARRDNLVRLEESERRTAGFQIGGASPDSFEAAAGRVTMADTIRAQIGMTDAAAGRAREVSEELARRSGRKPEGLLFPTDARPTREQRAVNATTGAPLIQMDVGSSVIDILRAKSVVMGLGATRITGLQGNLGLPRIAGSASTFWVADGTAITESAPTLDSVPFTPHHVGGLVTITRQLLQQSSPDATAVVEGDLVALLGTAIDTAAISGIGTSGQPLGLLNAAGLPTVAGGANGAPISWTNIVALIGAVDTANALDGRLGFVSNSRVAKTMRTTLKTTADTSSNFILGDAIGQLAGYPLAISQNVPSTLTKGTGTGLSAMIFGDWSSLVIAEWSAIDILANPFGSGFNSGAVQIRAMATIDINFRHVQAFAALADVVAA